MKVKAWATGEACLPQVFFFLFGQIHRSLVLHLVCCLLISGETAGEPTKSTLQPFQIVSLMFFFPLISLFFSAIETIWLEVNSVVFDQGLLVRVVLKVDTERSFMTFNNDGGQTQTHHSVPNFSIMNRFVCRGQVVMEMSQLAAKHEILLPRSRKSFRS